MEKVIVTDQFGRTTPIYILDKDMYEIVDAPETTESNLDLPDSGDNK